LREGPVASYAIAAEDLVAASTRWVVAGLFAVACQAPSDDVDEDGVLAADDCDDQDAAVGAATTWYPDCDGDGVGAPEGQEACDAPSCDAGPGTWRGADEPHDDCDDTNPDATAAVAWHADCDGDGATGDVEVLACGVPTTTDCAPLAGDWLDAPSAVSDCDDTDAAVTTATLWYVDCDADGALSDETTEACGEPADPPCDLPTGEWSDTPPATFDCDDRDAAASAETTWYVDCDFDGVPSLDGLPSCARPSDDDATDLCGGPGANWSDQAPPVGDCDDLDEDVPGDWRIDCDGDGRLAVGQWAGCEAPTESDAEAVCGAAGPEFVYCDVVEPPFPPGCLGTQDCDDDDPADSGPPTWRPDCDGDGFVGAFGFPSCQPPPSFFPVCGLTPPVGGWSSGPQAVFDCDDYAVGVNPGASEVADNGFDDDCDASTPDSSSDADGDGFDAPADCDDGDESIYPGAFDLAGDGLDFDCDGTDLEAPGPNDVYVAPWGDDVVGDGSAANPYETVGFASGLTDADAVLRVAEGDYEASGTDVSIVGGYAVSGDVWTWSPDAHPTTFLGDGPDGVALDVGVREPGQRVLIVGVHVENEDYRSLWLTDEVGGTFEAARVAVVGQTRIESGTGAVRASSFTTASGDAIQGLSDAFDEAGDFLFDRVTVDSVANGGIAWQSSSILTITGSTVTGGFRGVTAVADVWIEDSVVGGFVGVEISGGDAIVVTSNLAGRAAGLSCTNGYVEVARSEVSATTNPGAGTAAIVASESTVHVVTAILDGGTGGTTGASYGVHATGGDLLVAAALVRPGTARTAAALRLDGDVVATVVNSMLSPGAAADPSHLNVIAADRASRVTLDHVQVDAPGTGYVRLFGGAQPDAVVTALPDFASCSWSPVCVSTTTVYSGAFGVTHGLHGWSLASSSPAVDHGRDPRHLSVPTEWLELDVSGLDRPSGGVFDVGPCEFVDGGA
jgi:hypothetical protein